MSPAQKQGWLVLLDLFANRRTDWTLIGGQASHPESCLSGSLAALIYGHGVSLNPLELLPLLLVWTVPLLVGYFVIRLAVRHGVMDAHRRLPPDQSPPI